MINLFKARMSSDASIAVTEVLNSGYTGQGNKVEEFEDLLWKELKSKTRPITVNSCTSAIDLALELCGVGFEDEVICVAATCWASNCNVLNRGAKIVWADVDPNTFLISVDSVKQKITEKSKAIICVNWGGKLCNYAELKKFGIPVIEDAAHTWDVWSDFPNDIERGDYICYSFQSIKYLQTGDGGCLICPKEKEHKARLLRWFGLDRSKGASFRCTQNIQYPGHKYQMNDIAAAIGISNIPIARDSVEKQRSNAKYLIDNINNKHIELNAYDINSSYWIFSMKVFNKQNFIQYCLNNGIEASPVHYRNDLYDCTKTSYDSSLLGITSFDTYQVCIPNGWWLSITDLHNIVNILNLFEG